MGDNSNSESRLCKLQGGPADGMSVYLPTTHNEPHMLIFRMPCLVQVNLPNSASTLGREGMPVIADYRLEYEGVQVDTYKFHGLTG